MASPDHTPEPYDARRGLLRAAGWVGGAEVAAFGVRLALVPVRTALLDTEQFGELALWSSVLALTLAAAAWPLNGLTRFLPGAGRDAGAVLSSWLRVQGGLATAAVILLTVTGVLSRNPVWFVVAGTFLAELWMTTLAAACRSYQQFRVAGVGGVAAAAVGGIGGIALIPVIGFPGVLVGTVLGAVPATFIMWPAFAHHRRAKDHLQPVTPYGGTRAFVSFAAPLAVGNLALVGGEYLDRLLLDVGGVTLSEIGLYSFAYTTLVLPLRIIAESFIGITWNESVAAEARNGTGTALRTVAESQHLYVQLSVPVAAALCLFAPQVAALLAPSDYAGAAVYVTPVVFGVWVYGLRAYWSQPSMLAGRPQVQTWSALAVVVANVILNILLISPLGAMGAALATAASYMAGLAVAAVLSRLHLTAAGLPTVRFPWRTALTSAGRAAPILAVGWVSVNVMTFSSTVAQRVLPAVLAGGATILAVAAVWRARSSGDSTSTVPPSTAP